MRNTLPPLRSNDLLGFAVSLTASVSNDDVKIKGAELTDAATAASDKIVAEAPVVIYEFAFEFRYAVYRRRLIKHEHFVVVPLVRFAPTTFRTISYSDFEFSYATESSEGANSPANAGYNGTWSASFI
jgi:hypothetical protein